MLRFDINRTNLLKVIKNLVILFAQNSYDFQCLELKN